MDLAVWGYSLCGVVWCGTGHEELIHVLFFVLESDKGCAAQDLHQHTEAAGAAAKLAGLGESKCLVSVTLSLCPLAHRLCGK